ncbi:ParB N-terminal domain-containing protein [Pseudomonas aeruginosa]|uniref:ParB/RepB/Spo0J family partition protein n=1 Tax=Pseudomonas aeruginosa TaxID=287 RepID=UPI00383A2985
MNANNQTETAAVAVAALEVADPTKNLILVALSRLLPRRSKRNVRKSPRLSIAELAASIERVGLLQNLIVILAADGEHYEVVAGDRRLTALKLLAKKKRISADFEVPCLLVADASARTVSLSENVQRENMHPADQFEAFAALVAEGRPVEDIAADFGVSPIVVQRRLRLGNVSPRLLDEYRADAVSLDQLMALAITDDHAAQEAAFYDAPTWQRQPSQLRQRLTERETDARHPLARFVGLDAYAAAGGGIRRDLFADDESGTYLTDAALLEKLAGEKLQAAAETVRAEGWAWVDATTSFTHADLTAFHTAKQAQREPNAREKRRIVALQTRIERTDAALEEAYEAEDEDKAEALHGQRSALAAQLAEVTEGLRGYADDVRAIAGAVVTVSRDGALVVHRGLLRETEANALRTLERIRQGLANGVEPLQDEDDEAPQSGPAVMSDRLAQRLSAHRTAALQIEVARHPQIALAAVVHGMVQKTLQESHYSPGLPLGIRLTVQDRLHDHAPDIWEWPAALALRELQQATGEALPEDSAELFAVLLEKSQEELLRLLAVCVASTVDVVTPRAARHQPGTELAQAVGLDMTAWWYPTAANYFGHVSKAAILEAVADFAPDHAQRLEKLKKAELASEAERLAYGTGWMPAIFRADTEGLAHEAPDDETAGEDDPHTLAA